MRRDVLESVRKTHALHASTLAFCTAVEQLRMARKDVDHRGLCRTIKWFGSLHERGQRRSDGWGFHLSMRDRF